MIVRISATDPDNGGGTVGFNTFFQRNNFSFQSVEGGASRDIPIDGQFHEFTFSLAGLTSMDVVDLTGINLGAHAQDLIMNVDLIRFRRCAGTSQPGVGRVGYDRRLGNGAAVAWRQLLSPPGLVCCESLIAGGIRAACN